MAQYDLDLPKKYTFSMRSWAEVQVSDVLQPGLAHAIIGYSSFPFTATQPWNAASRTLIALFQLYEHLSGSLRKSEAL